MSVCGVAVGVDLYDALDNQQRLKFNSVSPESIFGRSDWLTTGAASRIRKSLRSRGMPTSDRTISFHYVRPETMYLIEFASRFIQLPEPGSPAKTTTKIKTSGWS
nr:unnamed protein product [Spirometra erinaceieuropaei]